MASAGAAGGAGPKPEAERDRFVVLLEQLTAQLQVQHQKEIDGLKAEIDRLKAEIVSLKPQLEPPVERACEPQCKSPSQDAPLDEPEAPASKWGNIRQAFKAGKLKASFPHHHAHHAKRLAFSKLTIPTYRPSTNPVLRLIEALVHSNYFDLFFSFLIALNAVNMTFEAQFNSYGVAMDLGYGGSQGGNWKGADKAFNVFGEIFGILFTIEIVLRIAGFRSKFVKDCWNWLDLFLVFLWLLGKWEDLLPVNPMLLRLARFAKLFRLVRLVRKIQGFDPLFLLTTAVRSSASILGWTCFLLFMLLLMQALLLHALLMEFYLTDTKFPFAERQEIFQYFGSFTSSLFSMFELTLANWPPISRALFENVHPSFIFITIAHKLTVGFALVGIINGVFIQETFKVAQQDDEVMLRRARLASRVHAEKMQELMETADLSGDNQLDISEFRKIFEDPGLKSWLASMEFSPTDVDSLFQIMDNGDGILTLDEITKGVAKFKGAARTIDLHMLLREHRQLVDEHRHLQATVSRLMVPPCAHQLTSVSPCDRKGSTPNRHASCLPFWF